MEATENDLPPSVPFRISGFPTLKFKQAGAREFIDYEGTTHGFAVRPALQHEKVKEGFENAFAKSVEFLDNIVHGRTKPAQAPAEPAGAHENVLTEVTDGVQTTAAE